MGKQSKKNRGHRGQGSIYQRADGLWVGSAFLGYKTIVNPDDPEGEPTKQAIRKVVYGQSQDEAQKKLLEVQHRHLTGVADDSKMTVRAFLQMWLDTEIKGRVDAATESLYRQRVDDYLLPNLGDVQLAKLCITHVHSLYQNLATQGHSSDLQNKIGSLLRRALADAVDKELIKKNVAMKVKLPRHNREEINPLTEAGVKKFLDAARPHWLYPMFLFAIDTGMRQGEIWALEWPDIDLETGTVTITKTAQLHNGRITVKKPKTRASYRRLRVSRFTLAVLRSLKALSRPGQSLVFPNRRGNHLGREAVRKVFHRLLAKAGLPPCRFHDLRHTHATLSLLKTKNIKAVSARLGHRDIRVTLNTYSHYLPEMEDELLAAMHDLLSPASATEVLQHSHQKGEIA